jgi:hypothetical protein
MVSKQIGELRCRRMIIGKDVSFHLIQRLLYLHRIQFHGTLLHLVALARALADHNAILSRLSRAERVELMRGRIVPILRQLEKIKPNKTGLLRHTISMLRQAT